MQKEIFSGNIVLFYAYDIGEDIDLDMIKNQHLIPTYDTPLSAKFNNYHIPLTYHVRADGMLSEGEKEESVSFGASQDSSGESSEKSKIVGNTEICYVLSKIHSFGVLSYCYRIPFKGSFAELKQRVIELKSEYDQLSDIHAHDAFERINPAVSSPEFCNLKNDYFIVHMSPLQSSVPSDMLMETYGSDISSLLRLELNQLSYYQQDTILQSRTGYYGNELMIIDAASSFIYDDKCYDSMELFDFVNIQMLELQYFDRLLDQKLNRFYSDHGDRFKGKFPVSQLAQLRVDISVITERLENSIRMSGDEYYTDIYERLAKKLALPTWRQAVNNKLRIIQDLYTVHQEHHDMLFEKRWTLVVVWLIAFESIVSLAHFIHYLMY